MRNSGNLKFVVIFILTVAISVLVYLYLYIPKERPQTEIEPSEESKKEEYISTNIVSMTIAEKIGQMFIWGIGTELSVQEADMLKKLNPGGVIIMGRRKSEEMKKVTLALNEIGSKIPLFIAVDQEGGAVKRITDDQNPGAGILSKMDEEVACEYERNTTSLLLDSGINVNFGIVADIGYLENTFLKGRAFSDDPDDVSSKVETAINCSVGIIRAVKHFPGHGSPLGNSHDEIPVSDLSRENWMENDFAPFKKAIGMSVEMIMIGHLVYSSISGEPATLSSVYPGILRSEGYEGVIITDDLGMLEKSGMSTYDILEKAIRAGNDILLVVDSRKNFEDIFSYLIEMYNEGTLTEEDINRRIRRILGLKYHLLDDKKPQVSTGADYIVITETPVPTPTFTPSPTPKPRPAPRNLEELFEKYSSRFSVSRDLLKKIADCESHFNPGSVNGPYGGMFQFHEGTWINTRRAMNENTDPALRFDAEEAIKTAAYKISVNGAASWPSCSR